MSCNSMYSMHSTFYSSSLSSMMSSLFLSLVLILSFNLINLIFIILFSLILFLVLWINDLMMENSFSFTRIEQFSLVYGMKMMMLSEWMLFFARFWGLINFSLMSNAWCLFFCFPLLSSNSFAMPYSNVILLLFSSPPIQSASIFYKIGLFNSCIEQLSQTMSCGIVFLMLQMKEFLYSYLSMSDSMIGSIFYFTTGLHGAHVFFGLLSFWLMLMLMVFIGLSSMNSSGSISMNKYCSEKLPSLRSSFLYLIHIHLYYWMSLLLNTSLFIILFFMVIFIYTAVFGDGFASMNSSNMVFIQYASLYYIEFNVSMFFSSYYWHFVDVIWFFVFFMYFIFSLLSKYDWCIYYYLYYWHRSW